MGKTKQSRSEGDSAPQLRVPSPLDPPEVVQLDEKRIERESKRLLVALARVWLDPTAYHAAFGAVPERQQPDPRGIWLDLRRGSLRYGGAKSPEWTDAELRCQQVGPSTWSHAGRPDVPGPRSIDRESTLWPLTTVDP